MSFNVGVGKVETLGSESKEGGRGGSKKRARTMTREVTKISDVRSGTFHGKQNTKRGKGASGG